MLSKATLYALQAHSRSIVGPILIPYRKQVNKYIRIEVLGTSVYRVRQARVAESVVESVVEIRW